MDAVLKDFDFNMFEAQWKKLSEEKQTIIVEIAEQLDPADAIIAVLAGITSYHFHLRNNAKRSLETIQHKIHALLADPSDKEGFLQGMKASASVCARICAYIRPGLHFNELSYFFTKLLEFEGKGAFFAYRLVYRGLVCVSDMEKIISNVSEHMKLAFVDQYIQTSPSARLKFGLSFKGILRSIQHRKAVVEFYAGLFDRRRDADPILYNINAGLRDPDKIIFNEIQSQSPDIKIMGLKALSMMVKKISPVLLINILKADTNENVRLVIYKIIENSSKGMYPELFCPILEIFYESDLPEAFAAFKALLVSGKLPPYALIELVKKKYPALMPVIMIEISELSKISFFIIQDIALNKEKYLNENFDVNLACVLGMIKKRPERVVNILNRYGIDSKDSLRSDVVQFIEKIKQFLHLEKKSIETEFDSIISLAKKNSKTNRGFIQKFFLSPSEKKIEALKKNTLLKSIDFKDEVIQNIDLSCCSFFSVSLFFCKCNIRNCDFSRASFFKAFFKKSLFYNVDMHETEFDRVNFDDTVFINVNAQNATFKNCSFQNVSVFNCNFNCADMTDASFLNAVISKTSFNRTKIAGACFAHSRISAVSFVDSNIEQADFSNVSARFCRFPSGAGLIVKTQDMDYNAREFQVSLNDMPKMDKTTVAQINILIFSEFIHYGEKKFLKQNQLSLLTAFDIFKTKQADLFQIIPFLLHEHIEFQGVSGISDKTPRGICDYVPSFETQEVLKKYISIDNIPVRRCKNHAIEGLFTIGSIGSIAQTSESDIDYWICINEDNFTEKELDLLKKKLKTIEHLALYEFDTTVMFFLVDIIKTKHNDFGESTFESSGSAQTRLLKEEFYRTMIYVAGKIPLWSVLPTAISINYYNTILNEISNFSKFVRYMDLGDIHAISTNEYFGASIWQMFKWLKSPFKSVIKIALLEKYIYEYGKESLLCNKYKDEWMNSGIHLQLAQNDAYYILLKNLINYYQTAKDEYSVNLMLTCFFLKLGISKEEQIDNTVFGLRKILLEKCLIKWSWKKNKIFYIGGFKTWPYSDIVKLSNSIKKYMKKKHATVKTLFQGMFHDRSRISPEDRIVLERRVSIEFSKQPGKVDKILLISQNDRHFQGLHLKYIKRNDTIGTWELFNKNKKSVYHNEESLIKAKTIEEIGAWLINNNLYKETAVVNLIPNPTYASFNDIRKLYKTMYDFFSPVYKKVITFDQLSEEKEVIYLFVSINFYSPRQQQKITEYTAVYLNSWGEIFCKSFYSDHGFSTMEETKKDLMNRIGLERLPENTVFYFSKGAVR
ncbi:class I adenylate cyclase [Desulfobacula toluolica]|uniref:Cya: adenylate cyclase n=1 Tax=Desulfobacula toluolica (strain DSM 7467 / Tol2) TaxID=651182 RepID=K0NLS8_DESTT|nr:class I adenylate cyclase [Desulfobacula toluolica]CCK79612.1 Cya: adenylate cyclase [Desulfobacula toluolica Tol2]